MFNTVLGRTYNDTPKKNVTNWHNETQIGLRINWAKLPTGILLVAVGSQWPKFYSLIVKPLLNPGGLFGLLVVVALISFIVVCIHFRKEGEGWPGRRLAMAFAAAIVLFIVAIWLLPKFNPRVNPDRWSLVIGLISMIIIVLLLGANSLTRWWPHNRDTINR